MYFLNLFSFDFLKIEEGLIGGPSLSALPKTCPQGGLGPPCAGSSMWPVAAAVALGHPRRWWQSRSWRNPRRRRRRATSATPAARIRASAVLGDNGGGGGGRWFQWRLQRRRSPGDDNDDDDEGGDDDDGERAREMKNAKSRLVRLRR